MKIDDAGPRVGVDGINALETALGARLAEDYRAFLLLCNGGAPTPDIIDIPDFSGSPTDVQVFFGIGRQIETSDLYWNLSLISSRCPEYHLLPIACDSGGNLFCLKVDKGIATEVVYCDLERAPCVVYFVTQSFDEFVKRLRLFNE